MINLRIQTPESKPQPSLTPRITVVGVGGAGGNAVNNMIATGLDGVEFLVCNTDAQALAGSRSPRKIQLGTHVTGGLGAGAKPEVGRAAAEESLEDLMQYIEGSNMVFITSGMGGGTGTGVSPVLARACKEMGILTVGVVTKPFHFEGTMRMKSAEEGIKEMQQYVDTLIVIPNQNLFRIANQHTTFADAFKLADAVLQSAVRGVTDLMVMPGLVNLDFNDIKTTMTEMGKAMMGTGQAAGDRRSVQAAEAAINNPLLDDVTMKGAKGVIINIAGGQDMTLFEIDEACNRIREEVDVDANIIFGTSIDDTLDGSLRVTVIATGIETEAEKKARDDSRQTRRYTESRATQTAPQPAAPVARDVAAATAAVAKPYGAARYSAEPVYHEPAPAVQPAARAYTQGGAFIPPAPVDADQSAQDDSTVSYQRISSGVMPKVTAPEPVMGEPDVYQVADPVDVEPVAPVYAPAPVQYYAPAPVSDVGIPSGLVPTAGGYQPVPRRAPEPALSLFQRITNRVRKTVESFDDSVNPQNLPQNQVQQPVQAPNYVAQPARGNAQPAMAQQPSVTSQPIPAMMQAPVDVARPAKAPGAQPELDLEIPAFLRRQAS
jgi:cell division protein FtsZ